MRVYPVSARVRLDDAQRGWLGRRKQRGALAALAVGGFRPPVSRSVRGAVRAGVGEVGLRCLPVLAGASDGLWRVCGLAFGNVAQSFLPDTARLARMQRL